MNLFPYSAQIAVMAVAGALLPLLFRVRLPRAMLVYWQGLLAACVLMPLIETHKSEPGGFARFSATAAAVVSPHSGFVQDILPVLIYGGAALRLAWLGVGLWKLNRIRKNAQRLDLAPSCIVEIERRLIIHAEVYVTDEVAGPASFGNKVVFPKSWLRLDPASRRAIACHELLHLARRDWPFHLIEEITRAVFWFHPAVWWLVNRIRLTREQVIDREVLRLEVPRDTYMQALLTSARSNWSPAPCFSSKHQLVRRLESIVHEVSMEVTMSKRRIVFATFGIAIGLAAAGHFAVWSFPLQSSSGRVYKMAEGITPPKVVYKVDPAYTEDARDAKIQGTVSLTVEITPEGSAQNVQVIRGIDLGLDTNAVSAVQQWRFQPGMKDGQAVTVAATIEVNFRLK
ncbi:MAG: M56 family metallopeptidase [Acidobacteriota bacterium]|nr:M56 family metallopeptidase [Acidobacteriota bacterium]